MNRSRLAAAATSILVGITATFLVGAAPVVPERTQVKQLSPEARAVLRPRMQRHGAVMDVLIRSVVMLDRARTADAVDAVIGEARLARPLPGDTEMINAAIPPLFFDLQDHLQQRAQALRTASAKGDDVEVAVALGQVMQTCVACHSAYLEPARRTITPR